VNKITIYRTTKVPNDQSSEPPMFQATNVPSYHETERPCNKFKNRGARNKVREPKNENRRTKSLEQNPWSKNFGAISPKFFASWVVKLTRNPTFGISFCIAVKGKQVVLLLVHGFAALTKVFCRLLTHRSGQKPLFAEGKIVSEEHVDQVITVRPFSEIGCRLLQYD